MLRAAFNVARVTLPVILPKSLTSLPKQLLLELVQTNAIVKERGQEQKPSLACQNAAPFETMARWHCREESRTAKL